MSQILNGLVGWLHALATIIFVGNFLLLSLIYLPVLGTKDLSIISEVSKRSRSWIYASLPIFAITGVYQSICPRSRQEKMRRIPRR